MGFCEYMSPRPSAKPGDHLEFMEEIHEASERITVRLVGGGGARLTVCKEHQDMLWARYNSEPGEGESGG